MALSMARKVERMRLAARLQIEAECAAPTDVLMMPLPLPPPPAREAVRCEPDNLREALTQLATRKGMSEDEVAAFLKERHTRVLIDLLLDLRRLVANRLDAELVIEFQVRE